MNERFAATLAIRRCQPEWNDAAQKETERVCRNLLADECGATIARLPKEIRAVLATVLVARIAASYLGVLEDAVKVDPAAYLNIVRGGR